MSAAIPVLVTGVGGGGVGEQILKALRLAELDYEVVGTDVRALSSGLTVVEHPYVAPPASAPEYVPAIRALCERHGVRAVFPGSEPELRALAPHASTLRDAGAILAASPVSVLDACLDKVATMQQLERLGFAVPAWAPFTTVEEALAFELLPAVVKPSVGGGGSADLYLCQDRDELAAAAAAILRGREQAMVQAYVGTPETEFTVGVLVDLGGALMGSIALRRDLGSALSVRLRAPNRSGRAELGPTLVVSSGLSQGWVDRFPEVTRRCEEIALAIGARGAINVQCRLVGGEPLVFEINPRFSGTTSLRALVGYNEPDSLVRLHVLGQSVARPVAHATAYVARSLAEHILRDLAFPAATDLL